MDKIKIAIVGAGQTGRGFLARLFHRQAEILLIDSNRSLIDNLRESGSFTVRYFNNGEPDTISGYEAHWTGNEIPSLKNCDVVFISVRPENTAAAGMWLEDKIRPDAAVIVCENAAFPAELLATPLKKRAGSGAVFCTTVNNSTLDILSEDYPVLHVDGNLGAAIKLSGIKQEPDFAVLMQRKIYTYNAASAIIAYLGAAKGYDSFPAAANDREIAAQLDNFYTEINNAICKEFAVEPEEQRQFALLSKLKFQNTQIADSIVRNAASPKRKLGASERIIQPAKLILAHGGNPDVLAKTAAAALRYMDVDDIGNVRNLLQTISGLSADEPLFSLVLEAF